MPTHAHRHTRSSRRPPTRPADLRTPCSAAEELADGTLNVLADLWQSAAAPSFSPSPPSPALLATAGARARGSLQTARIEAYGSLCTGGPPVADSDDDVAAADLPSRFASAPWAADGDGRPPPSAKAARLAADATAAALDDGAAAGGADVTADGRL